MNNKKITSLLLVTAFMMSDDKRIESGCGLDDITVQLLPDFWISRSKLRISATDDSYYSCMDAQFERLDEENKILYYTDGYGNLHEIKYGSAYG